MRHVEADEDLIMIVISDLWLDQPRVLEKFQRLLEGYTESEWIPMAFILMGDFISEPFAYNGNMSEKYASAFNAFTEILLRFPKILRLSQFILVAGPNDPWGGNVHPKLPLPRSILDRFVQKIPHVTLASNPCRIRFCSQEIVVFREDLLGKMQRNVLLKPNMNSETAMHRHVSFCFNESVVC